MLVRNEALKRLLEVSLSGLGVIVLAPMFAAISVLIRREDGGAALFRQERVGQDGQMFTLFKFRTMKIVPAATSSLDTSSWSTRVPDDFVFKAATGIDPRLTTIGVILRRTSLDELPQLLNVLSGTMSLVGPRPEIPLVANHYDAEQRRRLTVKPGITGWAQVNGRAESSHGAKIQADLFYVEHASLRLDLVILARTLFIAVTGRGAY